tara:strand:+ start:272 stop:664 length:393 start_codon:yes stop_codon:yes gene_type:complete
MKKNIDTHKNPEKTIYNWLDVVSKHNPVDIVNLYTKDGVLLGTLADNIKKGRNKIIDYFIEFVKKKPTGEINSILVQENKDIAIVDGTYTFSLKNEEGVIDYLPARFTFVLKNIEGNWLIATHHSSKQPI